MKSAKRVNTNNKKRPAKKRVTKPENRIVSRNLHIHGVPDRWIETFTYNVPPTNDVGSGGGGAINYYLNSMQNYLAGQNCLAAYYGGIASNYERGLVIKSKVRVTVSSREATKYVNVVVVPVDKTTTLNSAGAWSQLSSLPYARTHRLSPQGSGGNTFVFTQSIKPEKLIGVHYNTQDEYSFVPGADPTTLIYWLVGHYNPDGTTPTTGGIQISLTVTNTVKFFEPDRDNSVSLKIKQGDVQSMLNAQSKLLAMMNASKE